MATVIEFPTHADAPLDDIDLAWLGGYCLAQYERVRLLRSDAEPIAGWIKSLRRLSGMGFAPPSAPDIHLQELFIEAVNREVA
jgi:hypothetical protein